MEKEKYIKVGVVEDQQMFRVSFIEFLNTFNEIEVVFESPDGFSVEERLQKAEIIPDIMLIDFSLPRTASEEFNGFRVMHVLRDLYRDMKFLIVSANDDEFFISKLIEEGAQGFIAKDSHPREVHDAILSVYNSGVYINSRTLGAIQGKMAGTIKKPKEMEDISSRELDVLRLICQQMTTDAIAEQLFISPKTVNGHRNNLFQKTGSKNMIGLVIYAVKHGLVEVV